MVNDKLSLILLHLERFCDGEMKVLKLRNSNELLIVRGERVNGTQWLMVYTSVLKL